MRSVGLGKFSIRSSTPVIKLQARSVLDVLVGLLATGLTTDVVREKVHIDRALAGLKKWRRSLEADGDKWKIKIAKRVRALLVNSLRLIPLRNFFSFSSCLNNLIVLRDSLVSLIKKSPDEDGLFLVFVNQDNYFFTSNIQYETKIHSLN